VIRHRARFAHRQWPAGPSNAETLRLQASVGLVGYQRRIHGHLFGSCNPLYDIPQLLDLYRAGRLKLDELITPRYTVDEVNQAYEDLYAAGSSEA
jgi:Zn-dependent alcohol dehydrogenase